jgi:hypothetical protein
LSHSGERSFQRIKRKRARERFLDGSHPAGMTRLEMADCSYKLGCMYRDQIECKNLTVGTLIIASKLTERS